MKPYGEDEGTSASPVPILRQAAANSVSRRVEIYRRPDVRERRKRLAEVIDSEILPRLLSIHHGVGARPASVPCTPEEIEEFGALAIGAEPTAMTVYFERARAAIRSKACSRRCWRRRRDIWASCGVRIAAISST